MTDLIYLLIIYPILFIFPAYCANGAPVVFGGGAPLDFGLKVNGKRLFGDHKTIKGLISGLCSGVIIGFGIAMLTGLWYMLAVGAAQGVGAMFGDLVGSFIKRQRGLKEGSKDGIMDRYLFIVFAFIFSAPFGMLPYIGGIVFIFLLTGFLHRFTNSIAHSWKLKDVPW